MKYCSRQLIREMDVKSKGVGAKPIKQTLKETMSKTICAEYGDSSLISNACVHFP
jgi:hypothetical protein